jgi:hypothetical protein
MVSIEQVPSPTGEEHYCLLTRSSLGDYLSFMGDYASDGTGSDRRRLVNEWKAAASRMEELRESEPDIADGRKPTPLPTSLRNLAARVQADPIYQKAFDDGEYEIALVDLDRVIVSQKLVCIEHLRRLQERLGEKPTAEQLFRFCLPVDRPPVEHRASRTGDDEFAFTSKSNDLRFLEAVMLRPDQLVGYQANGPVAGVIALVVGYGSNFLNVLSIEGRLLLNNGHHRACALWESGIRNVPCIVQTIEHPDEIQVHAPRPVRKDPAFYLTDPRPPLLRDYFDPVLSRRVHVGLTTKQVRVRYSIDERDMP